MKKIFSAILLIFLCCGCSRESWLAKFHIVRAEEKFTKASEMRSRKDQQERRLKIYRESCDHFLKAYRIDPAVFTLYRIEIAYQACRWVDDSESSETFRAFEEEYAKQHPTETEFGDAMPPPPDGG